MIAVDTNILVRFLVRDDEKQAEIARRRLKQAEENRERPRFRGREAMKRISPPRRRARQ